MKLHTKKPWLLLIVFLFLICFQTHVFAEDGLVSQPELKSAKAIDASSIMVKWTGNPKEDGMYVIYRKTPGKPYEILNAMLADSDTQNTYTDSNIVPNLKYTYTVCSVPASSMTYCSKSSSYRYSDSYTEATFNWDKYTGKDLVAYVCSIIKGKSYYSEVIDKKSTSVKYYLEGTDPGKYEVDVYALTSEGWSSYDKKGVTASTTIKTVSVKKPSLVGNGTVKLTWSKSQGASGYYIYRKSGNGKWKKIQTIDNNTVLYGYDDTVKKGKKYQYKVKAYVSNGTKTVTSKDSNITKKVKYSSVAKNPSKNLYKTGNQYMAGLSSKEIKEVQAAAKKFYQTYITSDMSDVEKVIAAQAYLAATCVYGTGTKYYTAWGAMVYKNKYGYHEATCYGYSYAMQALCASMGIECKVVKPDSKAYNPNHMWTMVKVEKKWYILDPQPNANYGIFSYFLLSGKTYTNLTGESFNTKTYSGISKKDYSRTKLNQYASSYKVYRTLKKMKLIK